MKSCNIAGNPNFSRWRYRLTIVLGWAATLIDPKTASAENVAELPIAQALFKDARDLMTSGKYDEACAKFAESQRLDPASGTLLNLAICFEKQGKTATAWAEYHEVLSATRMEGNAERQKIATDRIRDLEPRLCHISVIPTAELMLNGQFHLRVDGVELGSATWKMPVPVDPGSHRVDIEIPGKTPWSGSVLLARDGASSILTVITAKDTTRVQANVSASNPGAVAERASNVPQIIGGLGVLSLGAGVYFGLRAKSEWNTRNEHCPNDICDAEAVSAARNAHTDALITDVAVGAGLVGIGVAAYMALFPGRPPAAVTTTRTAWVALDGQRLILGGAF